MPAGSFVCRGSRTVPRGLRERAGLEGVVHVTGATWSSGWWQTECTRRFWHGCLHLVGEEGTRSQSSPTLSC